MNIFEIYSCLLLTCRNVIHYSQGTLDRWRLVEDTPDLIIFEGGGSEELISERLRDKNWHFSSFKFIRGFHVWSKKNMQVGRKTGIEKQPLTTVYYLFNTLDIEMIRAPRMESLWSKVEALYVHGLKIHPFTGSGGSPLEDASLALPLGQSLKRCFVLVGSWDGKSGVNQVDFVKQAQERLRKASLDTPAHQVACSSTCASSSESGTLYHSSSSSSLSSGSSLPIYFNHPQPTRALFNNDSWHAYKGYESDSTLNDDAGSNSLHECEYFDDDLLPPPLPCDPFHILIPQIAYSPGLRRPSFPHNDGRSKMRGKKGAYYIARTLGECLEMNRGKSGEWSGEVVD